MARLNRPAVFVYGGTILPGCMAGDKRHLDIVSVFEAVGAHAKRRMDDRELQATAAGRVERDERDGLPAVVSGPAALALWRAAGGYVTHFEPSFLFVRGDGEWRHHSSTGGLLLLFGMLSMGISVPFVLIQKNYRRLLAYHTIDHAGIMATAAGVGATANGRQ